MAKRARYECAGLVAYEKEMNLVGAFICGVLVLLVGVVLLARWVVDRFERKMKFRPRPRR